MPTSGPSPPRGCEGQKRIWQREVRSGLWPFLDRVNTLGVEGEIILDRHDGSVWGLITPHSIDRTLAAERNAEVATIPLVRAVGGASVRSRSSVSTSLRGM